MFSAFIAPINVASSLPSSPAVSGTLASNSGRNTFFYQEGAAGACGTVHSDYDLIAAVSSSIFTQSMCGNNIWLYNPSNGATFSVTVADECPGCGPQDLDLSVGAFEQLTGQGPAGLNLGVIDPVDWDFF